jgi:hypothetical protein
MGNKDSDRYRIMAAQLRGVMLKHALASKSQFINWSQFTLGHTYEWDRYMGRGLCHGLSMHYLDCVKRRVEFTSEFNYSKMSFGGEIQKKTLHDEVQENAVAGNTSGLVDLEETAQHMRETFGLRCNKTEVILPSTRSDGQLASFVTWPSNYYLVLKEGHTMAATAAFGSYHFFDPNIGIVRSNSRGHMQQFIKGFFGDSDLRAVYGKGQAIKFKVLRCS